MSMGFGDLVHSWKLYIRSLIQAGYDQALDSCRGLEWKEVHELARNFRWFVHKISGISDIMKAQG